MATVLSWKLTNLLNFALYLHVQILHGLSPAPLREYLKSKSSAGGSPRSVARGDRVVPYRRTNSSQYVFSVDGCNIWNSAPFTLIVFNFIIHLEINLKFGLNQNNNAHTLKEAMSCFLHCMKLHMYIF